MASSHSIGASSSNLKSFIFSIIGFVFIIGLFFIPEILNFKKSAGTRTQEVKTFQTSQNEKVTDPSQSELSKITALVDSGYLKKISESNSEQSAPDLKKSGNKDKEAVTPLDPKRPTLTWDTLKQGDQRRAFKNADDQINKIMSSLSGDNKDSRLALMAFSTLIKRLSSNKIQKDFTAQQALTALESAHTKVVNSFISDGVGTINFKRFVGINFGPIAKDWSAKLSGKTLPFNPHLTLSNIQLTNRAKKGSGLNDLYLGLEGYVIGDDVVKIDVVAGGIELDSITPRKSDKQGYRKFRLQRFALNGKVLFKVYDRSGRVFQKLYSIYPRAKIFENEKGVYSIPKSMSLQDLRLDRYFTMSTSASESGEFGTEGSILESNGFERF